MILVIYPLLSVVMAIMHAPRFLSVSEATIQLRVSVPTVRRWIKDGHLAAAQPAGTQGALRNSEAELDRLAGDHTED
jgi:excisionase family DNA binding protein